MAKQSKQSYSKSGKPNTSTKPKHKGVKPPYNNRNMGRTAQERREQEVADTSAAMSRSNPVAFYTKYAEFARDASKLPFSFPLGHIYDNWLKAYDSETGYTIPGVMALRFTPTVGYSKDWDSPINRSSVQYWTYLRSIMKVASSYDPADVMMLVVALDSAMMFHALCRRVYGLLEGTTPMNKYYPQALVNASGFNYSDIRKNAADFRNYINKFAASLEKYALPKDISFMERHQWMCEGLYVDGETTRAQTFLFTPQLFWQIDNLYETGTRCIQKDWLGGDTVTTHTYAQVTEFGDALLKALGADDDFATISGDLYTLYGGNMFSLPYIEESYQILPKYDKTVLSQIENATVVGKLGEDVDIHQNPTVNNGSIQHELWCALPQPYSIRISEYALMNMHMDGPTPDEVMESTRLIAIPELMVGVADKPYNSFKIRWCGTEIINMIDVYRVNPRTGGIQSNPRHGNSIFFSPQNQVNDVYQYLLDTLLATQFDWAPRLEWVVYDGTLDPEVNRDAWIKSFEFIGTTWDVANYAQVPNNQLAMIHEAALYSEFDIPRGKAGN